MNTGDWPPLPPKFTPAACLRCKCENCDGGNGCPQRPENVIERIREHTPEVLIRNDSLARWNFQNHQADYWDRQGIKSIPTSESPIKHEHAWKDKIPTGIELEQFSNQQIIDMAWSELHQVKAKYGDRVYIYIEVAPRRNDSPQEP